MCARLSKNCGTLTANDNCGTSRTVSSCGTCTPGTQTCTDNVCVTTCTPESATNFCTRLSKNCGTLTANDNCGTSRTVNSCGTCTPGTQTCTANVCVTTCTPETNTDFCTRLGKNCDPVTANDNCGTSRNVTCGTCNTPQTCGGGGTTNVCGIAWKGSCETAGTGTVTGTGAWFVGADSYGGTSMLTVPCTGPAAGTRCGPTPATTAFACNNGGRDGGYSAHMAGTKANGDIYLGVTFGMRPVGSTGVKFWYKSTGAANGGAIVFQVATIQNVHANGGWPTNEGTCDPQGWTTNPYQCYNMPTFALAAEATGREVTIRWADLVWTGNAGVDPAWWATLPARTTLDQYSIWIRVGLYGNNAAQIGSVDVWMDDVTFITN
jgi:hypothetical protein